METYGNDHSTLLADIGHEISHNVPFGDATYLNNCTYSRYQHRLAMLAEDMPIAGDVAKALEQASIASKYSIVGDPVVRSGINHALAHFRLTEHRTPLDASIFAIIELAERCLRDNSTVPPFQMEKTSTARLGSLPHHGWIWTNENSDDAATKHFHQLFERHLSSDHLKLIEPRPSVVDNLRRGAELLGELLPELSCSALNHTHLVAIVAEKGGAFISVTNPFVPGVIFLSERAASSPWEAADNLLHESLHAKFLDIEHTHAIMVRGYKPTDCLVRPPWRRPLSTASYQWPLTRLFTVVHVYLALTVFFSTMEEKSGALAEKYGVPAISNPARKVRQSLDRAEYLLQQLSLNSQHLGPAGIAFSKWLAKLAEKLDPNPRPAGAYLHLLADLYQEEANLLAPSIAKLTPAAVRSKRSTGVPGFPDNSLGEIVLEMLQREISSVRQLAERSGSNLAWTEVLSDDLRDGQPQLPEVLAARLWSVRALICQSLLQMRPSRFTSTTEPILLEDMLLNSSRHVEATLGSVQTQ